MTEIALSHWIGPFEELIPDEREIVVSLVKTGGAIVGSVESIAARLHNAHFIALLREHRTERIIAVGALKNPSAGYRLDKFKKAGVLLQGFGAAPELGYVVVRSDLRGKQLSSRIIDLILGRVSEPIWATTDNNTMRNNLRRSGFVLVGSNWKGEKGDLTLWTYKPPSLCLSASPG